jgi:hypothetical protein
LSIVQGRTDIKKPLQHTKKIFKIPQRPLFVTFCIGDYKSLAAIAALPQLPVRLWHCLAANIRKYTKKKQQKISIQ